jgi:hypothetical protein
MVAVSPRQRCPRSSPRFWNDLPRVTRFSIARNGSGRLRCYAG